MNISDRPDFDALMTKLCIGLDVKPDPARLQTYWDGLQGKMSIIQFARVVEHCLGDGGAVKLPKLPEIWSIWRQVKDKARKVAAPAAETLPERSWGSLLVDSMFLTYLHQRRLVDRYQGDLRLEARRAACRELAQWWDGCRAEDMTPTLGECLDAFGKAMARIPDAGGAESRLGGQSGMDRTPIAAPGALQAET